VKTIATIAGVLIIVIGLLIQASASKIDQDGGKLIVVFAGLMLALLYFASGTTQKIAQWALCAPVLIFAGYLIYRRI